MHHYSLWWDQHKGGGRTVRMQITCDDWEIGKHVYDKLVKPNLTEVKANPPPDATRNPMACFVAYGVSQCFDPNGRWPRPSPSQ